MRTITVRPKQNQTPEPKETPLRDLPTTTGAVAVLHEPGNPPDFTKPITDKGGSEIVRHGPSGWFFIRCGTRCAGSLNRPATLVPEDCEVVV